MVSFKYHKKIAGIFALFLLFAAGMGLKGRLESADWTGIARRQEEGGSSQSQTFSYRIDGFEEQELTLDIAPVERTRKEAMELLEDAVSQWEEVYLGENESAEEVRYDLDIPSGLCGGLVEISCESSDDSILRSDGKILQDALPEEGELVELTVTFSYAEYVRMETYGFYILPPEEESAEWLEMQLFKEAQERERTSRSQTSFSLPDSIAGHTVIWEQRQDFQWIFIIFLGVIVVFCLQWKEKEDVRRRRKERNRQLLYEYPQMVDQISLLLDSGMTIRRAWERMLQSDKQRQGRRIFIEEMWITYREIMEGCGEREAYEQFGNRIGLMPYRRFGSLLSQNLSRGTGDIRQLLRKEAEEALEMRKNRARRMGEEAGTKMLFPMLVMLVLILLVLLLPAAANFRV